MKRLLFIFNGSGSVIYMNTDTGLYGNSMFYDWSFKLPNKDARTLVDIKNKIKSGDIRFKEGAEIYILGCKTSNHTVVGFDGLAEEFSEVAPNTYVIGSTNKSNPDPMKTNPKLDSNDYFSRGGGEWHVYRNGKKTESIRNPLNPNKTTINKK